MQLTLFKNENEIKELLNNNDKAINKNTALSCKEKEYKNNELQYQNQINILKIDTISYKDTIENLNNKNIKLITEMKDKNDSTIKSEEE